MPPPAQILKAHINFAVAFHLHENGQKTQAGVPDSDLFFASPGDFGIYHRPRLGTAQLEKDDFGTLDKLWRSDGPAVACSLAPMGQRIREVLNQRADL